MLSEGDHSQASYNLHVCTPWSADCVQAAGTPTHRNSAIPFVILPATWILCTGQCRLLAREALHHRLCKQWVLPQWL